MGRIGNRETRQKVISYEYNKLRGRIVERYRSQAAFSEAIGISKNAFSRKMKGLTQFSQTDIEMLCDMLDIKRSEIGDFFFC